jgi:hypothetical protein
MRSLCVGPQLYDLYGRNESRLWMHVDRTQTHVISCILHIAKSDDAENWPIIIEDYAGNTNEGKFGSMVGEGEFHRFVRCDDSNHKICSVAPNDKPFPSCWPVVC